MTCPRRWLRRLIVVPFGLIAILALAQQSEQKPAPAQIPDAPSASRPPQPLPTPMPTALPSAPPAQDQPTPAATTPAPPPEPAPGTAAPLNPPPPKPEIRTVPPGGASPAGTNSREELFTIIKNVNFVAVPVTVKDPSSGRLVDGLLPKNFVVFEDGVKQNLTYFTADPFFLSAAVIFDLSMPDQSVETIKRTFTALAAAFSPYDEVSLYTYGTTVSRLSDFSAVNQRLTASLNQLKTARGRNNGVPVTSGPLASGPLVNGIPVTGGGTQPVTTPPKETHVLNDAILRAAADLAHQDRTRRKVIFIISDGRELGSRASYADTLKFLLTNQITVYGVATDTSALPGYKQLSKLHIPRLGYDNILPKYAGGTGGEVFSEFSQQAIERAYATAMGDARNQYTLGYQTRLAPSTKYHDIEVRVDVPGLDVRAKAGYYPLPPGR